MTCVFCFHTCTVSSSSIFPYTHVVRAHKMSFRDDAVKISRKREEEKKVARKPKKKSPQHKNATHTHLDRQHVDDPHVLHFGVTHEQLLQLSVSGDAKFRRRLNTHKKERKGKEGKERKEREGKGREEKTMVTLVLTLSRHSVTVTSSWYSSMILGTLRGEQWRWRRVVAGGRAEV
jgi:hypothetical protein